MYKQIYGREKTVPIAKKQIILKKRQGLDTANLIFLLGIVMVVLFLYRISGGFTTDEKILTDQPKDGVVSVMAVTETEERELLQEVTVDPRGYLDGEWNLWEYIGDLMASLLIGG